MSSSPRRTTPDNTFGNDDQAAVMQDITINDNDADAETNQGTGGQDLQPEPTEATVLDKSALRRYSVWITLVAASALSYASLAVESPSEKSLDGRSWCFAVLATTLIISICVTGCFLAPDCNSCAKAFVSPSSSTGRFIELGLSLLVFIFWCIVLPIIMNPANGIAVEYTQIENANLYLASWVCFGCIVFIVGDLAGDLLGSPEGSAAGLSRLDPETGEYVIAAPLTPVHYQRLWETRRGKWFALTVITVIAMTESIRVYKAFLCGQAAMDNNNTCIDSKIAIAMTSLSAIVSVVMASVLGGIAGSMVELVETCGAVAATIIWAVALVSVTFGDGPGHSIGNLFFSTWGGFLLSLLITADCFRSGAVQRALAAAGTVSAGTAGHDRIEMQQTDGGDDSDI